MSYTNLNPSEEGAIWKRFYEKWNFSPSYQSGAGIDEQGEFLTISIANITDAQKEALHVVQKTLETLLGMPFYLLDWQHACYRIDSVENGERLPLGIFPDGDYHIFLDEYASNGSFSHPWRETICFFGPKVVGPLSKTLRASFLVLRQGNIQND